MQRCVAPLAVAVCVLSASCASTERRTPLPDPPAPVADAWAQPARDVLVHHCGRCHRSDLPTAVPGALAVFDLMDDFWYSTLSAEQLESLLRRMQGREDLDPSDLATIEAFVASAPAVGDPESK